ncbi:hypothetical protein [Embleya sp. NBC_00896]|uniref:hypothetical protein n=1 Tax=Embleya sp. NBC_00896 TaxID=2975961 RepID=UPI003865057C|nr:hypothetical protein OG928_31695 [Embleya sp. NBC_00896]
MFTVAPISGLFLDIYAGGDDNKAGESASPTPTSTKTPKTSERTDGARVIARSGDTGKVLWTSAPLSILVEPEPPTLKVINTAGGEFVIVVRRGNTPDEALAKSAKVVVVDSFPVVGSGLEVAPTRHIQRFVEGRLDSSAVVVGNGGVLFAESSVGPLGAIEAGNSWDPVDGSNQRFVATTTKRSKCLDGLPCEVRTAPIELTSSGMLSLIDAKCDRIDFSDACLRGFGVSDRWNSEAVAPQGRPLGAPIAVTGTAVIAAWWQVTKRDTRPSVLYVAHDLATGAAVASTECVVEIDLAQNRAGLPLTAASSPDNRYVVAGPLAFDLSAGKAVCLGKDPLSKTVILKSVGDSGIAYGTVQQESAANHFVDRDAPPAVVSAPVATGEVQAFSADTSVPESIAGPGIGIFRPVTAPRDPPSTRIGVYPKSR